MKKRLHHRRALASVASLMLFVYLSARTGPGLILDKIRLLGWGFAFLILLSGIRHALRAVAWSHCVGPANGRPGLLDFFRLRLVGEAFNDVTPAGPLLAETAKVVVISRVIPGQAGASSVVLENLIYALAALLFMLSGVGLVLVRLAAPPAFRWVAGGLVTCFLLLALAAGWMINRRILPVGRTLDYMKRAGLRSAFLERHQAYLRAVEQNIYDFFLDRRRVFLFALAIEFATNFTGIGEAYLILKVTATHASLFAAYLVECANRAIQLAFSFVPFGLGIQEGAAAATLEALGYAASEGVSLAIIRKIRMAFWAAFGLLLAAKYSIGRPAGEESPIEP